MDKEKAAIRSQGSGSSFERLLGIIEILRSPDGCPWDREQTPESLRPALVEEAYEIIDAIDSGDYDHVREELGDLYLVVSMIAYIYQQESRFSPEDALNEVSDKLVRRHPHVFGDVQVEDTDEVLKNWEEIKVNVEGKRKKNSALDGIPGSLPPLERAYKIQKRAAKAGFDWARVDDVFPKLREEIDELEAEIDQGDPVRLEEEMGDLLFSVVNLARKLDIDPAQALNRTSRTFGHRFTHVETKMKETDQPMTPENLDVMETFWNEAKRTPKP